MIDENIKMKWAEQLKEEYSKIAKENSISNLKHQNIEEQEFACREIGNTRDKIANDLDLGSGRNYDKAQYIYNNAPEELIQQLDDGRLSINKAYITLKEQLMNENIKTNETYFIINTFICNEKIHLHSLISLNYINIFN